MSIKKLLGIEFDHISDEEILEKMKEAREKGEKHIEIEDPEGNVIKIDVPGFDIDGTITTFE